MFNKFRSALYNVVGSFETGDGSTLASIGGASSESTPNVTNSQKSPSNPKTKNTLKFPYTRPSFLQRNSDDEIQVTADHAIRPIIVPRDISKLPWNSGYAEAINAGKSLTNEDQASVYLGRLTKTLHSNNVSNPVSNGDGRNGNTSDIRTETVMLSPKDTVDKSCPKEPSQRVSNGEQNTVTETVSLPYYYFGIFDGHAGWGAAVAAGNQLHNIIHEKLVNVIDVLIPDIEICHNFESTAPFISLEKEITIESAVTGALELAFWEMDQLIAEDRLKYQLNGGCTACIGLFILGKLYVANAGDSRGILCHKEQPVPMSFDFTPETENYRIRKLGARHPELLGGLYTHLDFMRRPMSRDLGRRVAYREHYMTGWSYKTLTQDDLKYPLVCGEGKRSRVLATIGVTRGFGDHDLKAHPSSIRIKPFLSPEPEVRIFHLDCEEVSDSDVLILATDGLWDVTANDVAVNVILKSLSQYPPHDLQRFKYRYTGAAQDLVMGARGKLTERYWKTSDGHHATIDDISVFVIPLQSYQIEYTSWNEEYQELRERLSNDNHGRSSQVLHAVNTENSNIQHSANTESSNLHSGNENSPNQPSNTESSNLLHSNFTQYPSDDSISTNRTPDFSDSSTNYDNYLLPNPETSASETSQFPESNNSKQKPSQHSNLSEHNTNGHISDEESRLTEVLSNSIGISDSNNSEHSLDVNSKTLETDSNNH